MDFLSEIHELLVDFGGDMGGEPGHVAVRFLLPTFFWCILAFIAFREWRQTGGYKDLNIGIAAVIGMSRELIMFSAEYGSLRGMLSFGSIYPFYPPFEHAATMLSGIFIASAFMNYLPGRRIFSRRYLLTAAAVTLIIYVLTAVHWPGYLRDNPGTPFGTFWGDIVYRVTASVFLGIALAVFALGRRQGARVQTALLLGMGFLFLDEFLMIFNLWTRERHVEIFAPIRHNLHIWAIPLFLGVYWFDLKHKLSQALDDLLRERLRSEAIISALADGISIQDRNFRVLYQNEIHKQLSGGDFTGQLCYEAYENKDSICEGCPLARSMADGRIHRTERAVPRGNGTLYVEITASPLQDSNEKIVAGIEVVRNITEKKRLDEEIAKSQRLESVGLLAGGLAHDFNNLLTGIMGNIGLAKRHIESENSAYERLVDAEQASMRAADLTRQLLTFSKGGTPVKRTVAIADIVREAVSFALSGSSVMAQFELEDGLHPVDADTGQVNRVFNNLALNAVQAMPEGGALSVTADNVTVGDHHPSALRPGDYVHVSLADTGVGIPDTALPKIFDPYFTTKEKGHGLGLATAYSIMTKHKGGITVESKPGIGTTFHLYFPASFKKTASYLRKEKAVPIRKAHVLVMDDEQSVRDTAGAMLRDLGCTCEFASDGAEAVGLYRQAKGTDKPFDLVIMDLTVPGGTGGREAVRKLLEIDPEAKAIVSSGYSNDPVLQEFEKHGFAGMLQKPYGLESLGRVIHEALAPVN